MIEVERIEFWADRVSGTEGVWRIVYRNEKGWLTERFYSRKDVRDELEALTRFMKEQTNDRPDGAQTKARED